MNEGFWHAKMGVSIEGVGEIGRGRGNGRGIRGDEMVGGDRCSCVDGICGWSDVWIGEGMGEDGRRDLLKGCSRCQRRI